MHRFSNKRNTSMQYPARCASTNCTTEQHLVIKTKERFSRRTSSANQERSISMQMNLSSGQHQRASGTVNISRLHRKHYPRARPEREAPRKHLLHLDTDRNWIKATRAGVPRPGVNQKPTDESPTLGPRVMYRLNSRSILIKIMNEPGIRHRTQL